jgi:hypothetical protein
MVVLKVIGEAFYIPTFDKRDTSFRGKRKRLSILIFYTNLCRDRVFFIYRDKRPDALRCRTLDL